MNNNNPTLIAGFENVMTHIRNQEKRIQDLVKENNRLNNEITWEWNEQVIGLKETIQELKEKNEVLEGTMKTYSEANMDLIQQKEDIHKRYQKKIDTLLSQKYELEAKVDEAQIAFKENKKFREEIETIQKSVEDECSASGIMEVMNSRIEEAESKCEEYKLKYEETRKRANEQTQTLITQKTIIRNLIQTIIVNDKNGDLWDDGIEFSTDWNLCGTGYTYHDIIEEEIDEMNENDWNEDGNRCKIIYEGHRIRLEINDTSSEEETDEDA